MAALGLPLSSSINPQCKNITCKANSRISTTIVSCQKKPENPHKSIIDAVGKIGKGVRETLSPKRKGDWKDVTLMSLSFAVYVYMSQKIVCAYCLWMSMSPQPW